MLIIPDIHIHHRHLSAILSHIQSWVDRHPMERDVVLLGDYVYMFSYDSRAIHQLYDLLLNIQSQDHNIYVMAGNHDWIKSDFVFGQAQKSWKITNKYTDYKIHFITEPETHQIDGVNCIFLPYMMDIDSIQINKLLSDYIGYFHNQKIIVFHHYYTNDTVFPGLKAKFGNKDICIDKSWLDYPDIQLVSGHIHSPFQYQNYLCLGSMRYTKSIEADQSKYLRRYDYNKNKLYGEQIHIGSVYHIDHIDIVVDSDILYNHIQSCNIQSSQNLQGRIDIQIQNTIATTTDISLRISSNLRYEDIDRIINPDLARSLADISIFKKSISTNISLNIESSDFQNSILDRKQLCKDYIYAKYADDAQIYIQTLQKENIL